MLHHLFPLDDNFLVFIASGLKRFDFLLAFGLLLHRYLNLAHSLRSFFLFDTQKLLFLGCLTGKLVYCLGSLLKLFKTSDKMLGLATTVDDDLLQDMLESMHKVDKLLRALRQSFSSPGMQINGSFDDLFLLLVDHTFSLF